MDIPATVLGLTCADRDQLTNQRKQKKSDHVDFVV